jgi:hypothetical protein
MRIVVQIPVVLFVFMLAGIPLPVSLAAAEENSQETVDFDQEIRPLLSAACFTCHGPDENKREADLRLDRQDQLFTEASSGVPIIVPGDPEKSELYRRLVAADEAQRMPPTDERQQLTAAQIERIKTWIQQGAKWDTHWAFVSPQRPAVPEVENKNWPRGAIDHFVLARLEQEGLAPSGEADRRTLVRRLTLDLTGLPPTPKEVQAFLTDSSDDAYGKLVDRLLATPQFGERLAVDWLDASRYADTHGFHEDFHRDMWPWRDWVIRALNDNMPFDQFATAQIAGDLLPDATNDQRVATGFNRNHGVTASGIAEEYRVEYVIDRVKTTSAVFLGLTMGCAQCHDHKYDPISQHDFYSFFAYFNTITDKGVENRTGNVDPLIRVIDPLVESATLTTQQQIAKLEKSMVAARDRGEAAFHDWEQRAAVEGYETKYPSDGLVAHFRLDETAGDQVADATGGQAGVVRGTPLWINDEHRHSLRFDGQTHVDLGDTGDFDRLDAFSFGAWIYPSRESIVLARVSADDSLRGYEVRVGGGRIDARLTHREFEKGLRVTTDKDVPLDEWSHVFVAYDGSSRAAGVKIYLNGHPQKTNVNKDSLKSTIRIEGPLKIGQRGNRQALLGSASEARIYNRALSDAEVSQLAKPNPVGELLAMKERTEEQQVALRTYFLEQYDAEYQKLRGELEACQAKLRRLRDDVPTVMVMEEMKQPRETFVLVRGQYDQHGEKVTVGTPAVFPSLPADAPPNRLGLAQWLTDPAHPLFSRVAVNRFWQMVFGTGIVKTAEDFGVQGDRPTHPELLDFLATEFSAGDWDTKAILKQMVMSATYRQSSKMSPELLDRDPENHLLARGPRYRLPAEMIRDSVLAVSGLLVRKIGGPSVKPYQPPGLWIEMQNRPYEQDKGDKLYRRSLYTYIKRSVPPPNMVALDAPNREICMLRRQRTSTPLMALVMLNDPTFVEASRVLAQRILLEAGPQLEDCIRLGFELALSRPPNAGELAELRSLYERQLAVYQADGEAAEKLVTFGESPRDADLPLDQHAAMTCVASVLLNLDETISKE